MENMSVDEMLDHLKDFLPVGKPVQATLFVHDDNVNLQIDYETEDGAERLIVQNGGVDYFPAQY